MSYTPANASGDLSLIAATVVAVIAGTTALQRMERASTGRVVAHCADGTVIGLWRDGIRRRPGRSRPERARARERHPDLGPDLREILEDDLDPGQLSFARVRRGREGEAAWVVDGLDRERAATAILWEFDDEAEARGALRRLEERIVRAPRDSDGNPILTTEADLDEIEARERAAAADPAIGA